MTFEEELLGPGFQVVGGSVEELEYLGINIGRHKHGKVDIKRRKYNILLKRKMFIENKIGELEAELSGVEGELNDV